MKDTKMFYHHTVTQTTCTQFVCNENNCIQCTKAAFPFRVRFLCNCSLALNKKKKIEIQMKHTKLQTKTIQIHNGKEE